MAGITFFAPNSKNAGGLLNVSFNSKDGAIFFRVQKQTGWDEGTKKGSFKGGAFINCKMTLEETSSFIRAIRLNKSVSFYHSFDGGATSGGLSYYLFPAEKQGDKVVKKEREGFGFTIKKENVEIKVGLATGSAEMLAQYLEFALDHCFSAIYANDKKEWEELNAKNSNKSTGEVTHKKKEKAQESEEVDDADLIAPDDDNLF